MLRGVGTTKTTVTWKPDGQKTLGGSHRKPEDEGMGIMNPTPYLTAEETEAQEGKDSSRGGAQKIDHS